VTPAAIVAIDAYLPPPAPPAPVPVEVLVADVLVAAEVLVTAADVTGAVLLPPPSPPPTWQFGLVLATPFGQQMSELPRSSVFDTQTRFWLVSQSSLPVVGSFGVAETLRSQR
jgi:hypothetical protein